MTRLPASAMAVARLAAVVVRPSPGDPLVTTTTPTRSLSALNCRLVRNRRYASERGESHPAPSGSPGAAGRRSEPPGISLRTDAPTAASTSAADRRVSSRDARHRTHDAPIARPTTRPMTRSSPLLGDVGELGSVGASTVVTFTALVLP